LKAKPRVNQNQFQAFRQGRTVRGGGKEANGLPCAGLNCCPQTYVQEVTTNMAHHLYKFSAV